MTIKNETIDRWLGSWQRGQAAAIMTLVMVALVGAAGATIDIGHLYYSYEKLLTGTQAAALAGGTTLANGTAANAIAAATSYSSLTGNKNAIPGVTTVTMVTGYPKVSCLTSTGVNCNASPSGNNAISVSERATMPTTFLKVVGIQTLAITATATASAKGGFNGPYNVVIILDTTSSMNSNDNGPGCGSTRISCALAGIRVLLGTLSPCYGGLKSCGASSPTETATVGTNVTNPVDEVDMMVFPGLTSTSQVPNDYACPVTSPSITSYNNSPVYQIIPFSSDYRTSDTATSLNSVSDLVKAAGGNGGCSSGLAAPGGQGTFYAGAIDAAQAQLAGAATARPLSKNVMIILSDGAANASSTQMTSKDTPYPRTQLCQQGVTAAARATAAGTTVYAVAYGAQSSGCSPADNISPCAAMKQMASTSQNFFSDYAATGGDTSCTSTARPVTSLNQIFQEIAADLTVARLIPNNTL